MRIADCEEMLMSERDQQSEIRDPKSEIPWHRSVLLQEVVTWLAPAPGKTIVDCTVGSGGHSLAILPRLLPDGQLIAIDCDAKALAMARQRLTEFHPRVQFVHDNFRYLPEILNRLGLTAVHGLIADLGLSSFHVDQADRGFSFLKEGPLDMRMDQRVATTAASLIHRIPERELAELIQTYGEERWARRIARRIVTARTREQIRTTTQLARLVAEAMPTRAHHQRIHPATRTFLALRIAVNEELACLESLLNALPNVLMPGGRAVVIAFHSLEDRLVKQALQRGAKAGVFRVLTKKPIRPGSLEVAENPRARSARLRAVERV